jgi:hypothetical protein
MAIRNVHEQMIISHGDTIWSLGQLPQSLTEFSNRKTGKQSCNYCSRLYVRIVACVSQQTKSQPNQRVKYHHVSDGDNQLTQGPCRWEGLLSSRAFEYRAIGCAIERRDICTKVSHQRVLSSRWAYCFKVAMRAQDCFYYTTVCKQWRGREWIEFEPFLSCFAQYRVFHG